MTIRQAMMKRLISITGIAVVLAIHGIANTDISDTTQNWPQWRGPLNTGVAHQANPPIE